MGEIRREFGGLFGPTKSVRLPTVHFVRQVEGRCLGRLEEEACNHRNGYGSKTVLTDTGGWCCRHAPRRGPRVRLGSSALLGRLDDHRCYAGGD